MENIIKVTEAADNYIQKKILEDHGVGFRLSIKKTGCSGFSYSPSIVKNIIATDIVCETEKGTKIFVDSAFVDKLEGVQIDYQVEDKSGLKQKRLIFSNPNESSRCGCGESFHV